MHGKEQGVTKCIYLKSNIRKGSESTGIGVSRSYYGEEFKRVMFRAVGVDGWWWYWRPRVDGNEWYLEGARRF